MNDARPTITGRISARLQRKGCPPLTPAERERLDAALDPQAAQRAAEAEEDALALARMERALRTQEAAR